jgi:NAD(P)-dependent dehydrogenase (short-subunit alcohol dehydrogenase family)
MSRKVLITGGSSGIGKAMVNAFSEAGDEVWFTYFGNELASLNFDPSATAFALDLRDINSIKNLVAALPGTPDVIIHNAGVGSATVSKVADSDRDKEAALLEINARGTLWLNQELLPLLRERNSGKIIFLSSVGGGITQVPGFNYADGMSKAAVAFLGKILAADLAQTGIDVFTICPGATDTPMFAASTLDGLSESTQRALVAALPKGRLIDPTEIAQLAYFLTTDAARALHGAVLDASMGLGVNPGLLQK